MNIYCDKRTKHCFISFKQVVVQGILY